MSFLLGNVVNQLKLFQGYLQAFYLISRGATLLEIKNSFHDTNNMMYDWIDATLNDHFSWRGVTWNNVTFDVVSL